MPDRIKFFGGSHQGNAWEKEYRNPKLVTKNDGPMKSIVLKKRIFLILGVAPDVTQTILQKKATVSSA
jgi:hypothetical protein